MAQLTQGNGIQASRIAARRVNSGRHMRVRTPTSNVNIWRNIRVVDVLSVLAAGPAAAALRDPSLFTDEHIAPTLTYCSMGFVAGLLMLIVFNLGKDLSDPGSLREVEATALASLGTIALTSLMVFSFSRVDFVPRSIPIIHFLVLTLLLLAGRVITAKWRACWKREVNTLAPGSQHVLIVGANRFALSYLRMLHECGVEQANIVAILDDDPKLIGRSLFGYPVIASPSAIDRVVKEYRVHGVNIDRVLIFSSRLANEPRLWSEIDEYCRNSNISFEFLGDAIGIKLDELPGGDPVVGAPAPSVRGFFILKRFFDIAISLAIFSVFLPVLVAVALGVLIDLGWPIVFWQKRVGYRGQPFLIYKFRTLHPPFDRHGRSIRDDQRGSRFGSFLIRTRMDELPQLWNVLAGDMSFVGPRPLLPVDQPSTSKLRLQVRPGVTGWAQIHGGKLVTADDKGVLDDWYVEHACFGVDIRIIMGTIAIVLVGDTPFRWRQVPSPRVGVKREGQPSDEAQAIDDATTGPALRVAER